MQLQNFFSSFRTRPRLHAIRIRPLRETARYAHSPATSSNDELFQYTFGRWIYNEHLRLTERYLKFDISALLDVIAHAFGRYTSDIVSLFKISEGGFNRVFQATFNDGTCAIARLPYPSTMPKHYATASEVATLDFLRSHGIRTPKVYAWSSTLANPVGAEYIVLEKLDGISLGDKWYSMTPKEQHRIMKQIVEWEARLMSLQFSACGSIYYTKERSSFGKESSTLKSGRGQVLYRADSALQLVARRKKWTSSNDIFRAVGERELTWTKAYAKPRLPYERLYREIHHYRQVSPNDHIKSLSDYLKLTSCLGFKAGTPLDRPVLRHPDFQPNNILVSESNEIVGLIDWQHSSILPLCLAVGIPKHFQNYGDPDSEKLVQPQLNLPPNYDTFPKAEQASIQETYRKRLVHFLYAAFTRRLNEEHYDAIFDNSAIMHQRLFKSAGTPWEGDSITLQADLIRTTRDWLNLISPDSTIAHENTVPPVSYSDKAVVKKILDLDAQQKEADTVMEQMRNVLDVDVSGWVPNEMYNAVKEAAHDMKAKMLKAAENDDDIIGIQNHFPFDDFDEELINKIFI